MIKLQNNILSNYSAYEIVMLVHELHKRGYEQMRLFAGMSPSGMSWRWYIYPKILMQNDIHFEQVADFTPFKSVHGSTNEDYPHDRELVNYDDAIKELRPYINLAKGEDKEYVEWFKVIVEHAETMDFPIAFAEYFNAKSWEFISKEPLAYPPIKPIPFSKLSDEQIIDYAKYTFDDFSVHELDEVLSFEGIRPEVSHIAEVIRQAISERKGVINHIEFGYDKILAYPYQDVESKEEIEHGLQIKLKTGEVLDLIDEIEIFVYKQNQ